MFFFLQAIPNIVKVMAQRTLAGKLGRQPALDLTCSRCYVNDFLTTPTFAYLAYNHATKKLFDVHWCSRHQAEVEPVRFALVAS